MKYMKKLASIGVMLSSCFAFANKDKKASSSKKLYQLLAQAPYSLVVFYDRGKEALKDATIKQNILDLETMLIMLSKSPFYEGADLQIIRVDTSQKDMADAIEEFAIDVVPTFMIFLGRQPKNERLTGFAYRPAVMAFIDQNLKEEMNRYMQKKEEQWQRELEIARIGAYNRAYLWGPYWNAYWYGGYFPYWYGPYWW
jgi:hypothetical protein